MSAKLLERDENGWRIPRAGTKSFGIYHLARRGVKPRHIARELGYKPGVVRILLFKIRHGG